MTREYEWTGYFIGLCFGIFVVFWIVAAFSAKRTVRRAGWWRAIMLIAAIYFFVIFAMNRGPNSWLRTLLWPHTLAIGLLADLFALAGLIVMLWARVNLAGNWSGGVVLKQDHELITRGPYRFVRHPIYTGLLLMFLGWAIWTGRVRSFMGLGLAIVFVWIKSRAEEKLMIEHFGDRYREYKSRVKALVPYVL